MPTFAVGTNVKLGYVAEVTPGITPASALQLVRITGFTPGGTKTSTQSVEMTTAREIADYIQTEAKGGWSFNHEFSYGNLDGLLESLFGAAFTTNVLKVGNTLKTLTSEVQFTDITQFCAFLYTIVNDFTLSVKKGSIINGTMGALSFFPIWSGTTVGTGAASAAPTNSVMDPVASVQLIQEGGAGAVAGPADFTMHLSNGIIDFPQLSSLDPAALAYGQFKAEGTLSAYFADRTYVDKWAAWTDTSLTFTLGGAAALKYAFFFPKVKLSDVKITGIAVNSPVVASMNWSAKIDATNTTCRITRTP
jgi:Phage tail tube protein